MEEELNLKEILKGIWKRKLIIIIFTVLFMIIGILYSIDKSEMPIVIEKTPEQEVYARTSFAILQSEEYVIKDSTVNTYLNIMTSNKNLQEIIEKFELDVTLEELSKSFLVRRLDYSEVIEISIINEEIKESSIGILEHMLDVIDRELKNIYSIGGIYIIDIPTILEIEDEDISPVISKQSSRFDVKKTIVVTFAGVIIGFVIVVGLEFIDGSIKNKNQIMYNLKINNLAIIDLKNSAEKNEDEYRKIKLNLNGNKTVLISNLSQIDIREDVVKRISNIYSKYNYKVAFVDVSEDTLKIYDMKSEKKLNNEEKKTEEFIKLLETEEIDKVIDDLKCRFDIVIINGNDMSKSINSLTLSRFVDGTICVVEERKTKLKLLEEVSESLDKINSKLLGTIIIKNKR